MQRRPSVTPRSQTPPVDASELRARACQEADELGSEPAGTEAERQSVLRDPRQAGTQRQ